MKVALFVVAMLALSVAGKGHKAAPVKLNMCPICISLMTDAMNELVQIAANGGVVGGCSALCGQLKNSLEADACGLVCDYVGITAFSDALNYIDPDPVFTCMLMDVCAKTNDASAELLEMKLDPATGPVGTHFDLTVEWNTTSALATGQLELAINGGQISGLGSSQMLYGQADGLYKAKFSFDTKPTNDAAWADGTYSVTFALCEGACGSSHAYSYTVIENTVGFVLNSTSGADGFHYHLYL